MSASRRHVVSLTFVISLISFSFLNCASIRGGPSEDIASPANLHLNNSKSNNILEELKLKAQLGTIARYIGAKKQREGVQIRILNILLANGSELKITVTEVDSNELAVSLLKERVEKTLSIYDGHIDPYFAIITKKVSCPQEFMIQRMNDLKHTTDFMFGMYANFQNSIGACTKDMAEKRAIVRYFTCRNRLVEIEKFVPLKVLGNKELEDMQSFNCLP